MSCIHYKFKSSLDYNTVTFDGLHLSLADLKKAIGQQKRLKAGEFDLEITNAQTGDVYKKPDELIAKNTSVIVSRVPVLKTTASSTQKSWEAFKQECAKVKEKERQMTLEKIGQTPDLANAHASEIDKIKAVIDQSTKGFEQSNFVGKHQPHENYVCKRCGQKGHFVTNCPNSNPEDRIIEPRYKRTTGIPSTMLTIVDDPMHPGALLTQFGQFAVPTVDVQGYRETKKERPPFLPGEKQPEPEKKKIPQELLCHICEDLCVDAAIAPCCGTSFCDECLREELLESDDHQCPSCKEINVSPDKIVANKSMRLAVTNFLNDSGYAKAKRRRSNSQSGESTPQTPTSKFPGLVSGSGLSMTAEQVISNLTHGLNAGGPRPFLPRPGTQSDAQRFPYRAPFNPYSFTRNSKYPADQFSKPWRYGSEAPVSVPNTISTISRRSETLQPRIHAEEAPPASQNIEKISTPDSGRSSPGEPAAPGTSPSLDRSHSQERVPKAPPTWHPAPTPLLGNAPPATSTITAPVSLGLGASLPTHRIPLVTVPPVGHQPFTAVTGLPGYPVPRPGLPVMPTHIPPAAVPLSREEFYQAKKMMQQQTTDAPIKKPVDVFDSFADFTKKRSYTPDRRRSYSRSRSGSWNKRSSRSRSLSPIKRKSRSRSHRRFSSRSRSRSRGWSRNRSRTRSPFRPQNRSRSRSTGRLQNRSRSRSYDAPKLSRPRSRSRSFQRKLSRSRSRSGTRQSKVMSPRPRSPLPPLHRSSKSSLSPLRRSKSPLLPLRRSSKSPLRRSSKSPLQPLRRSSKSPLPPLRRSSKSPLPPMRRSSKSPLPPYRSRSRSHSYRRLSRSRSKSWSKRARSRSFSRPRSPRPLSRSPRRSPLRSPYSKRSFSPRRRSRSFSPRKRSPFRSRSRTPLSRRKMSKSRSPLPKRRSLSPLRSPRRSKSPYKKPLSPIPFRRRSPSPYRGRGGYRGRGRGGYGYRDHNKDNRDRFRDYHSPSHNPAASASNPSLPPSNLPPVPYFPQMGIPPPEEYFKYNPAGYQAFLRNIYEGLAQNTTFSHQQGDGYPPGSSASDPALAGQRPPWDSVPMSPSQRPRSITPPSNGQINDRRNQSFKDRDGPRDNRTWDRERDRTDRDRDRERDRHTDRSRDSDRFRRDRDNNRRNRGREDDRNRNRDTHRDNRDREKESSRNRDRTNTDKRKSPSRKEDERPKNKDKKRPEKKKDEKENKKTKKKTESEAKKETTTQKDSILSKTSPVSEKDLESPSKGEEGVLKTEKQEILKPKNDVSSGTGSTKVKTETVDVAQSDTSEKPAMKEKKVVSKKKGDGVGIKKKVKDTPGGEGAADGDKKIKKTKKKKKLTFGADADTKQGLKKKKLKRLVDYKSENCTSEDGEERAAQGRSPLKKARLAELNQGNEGSSDSVSKNDNGDSSQVSSSELAIEASAETKGSTESGGQVKEELETGSTSSVATKKSADDKGKGEAVAELPELSKWEREEDFDYFDPVDQPKEKPQEKMMLPRSVVDKAEKFLSHKPMKNAVMVAHVTTSTKSPEDTPETAAVDTTSESSQVKSSRHVFVDRRDSKDKRATDLQITVKTDKRKSSDTSDRKIATSSKPDDYHHHHHRHSHYNESDDYEEDQRSVVRSRSFERELQDSKSSKSHRNRDHISRKDPPSSRPNTNDDAARRDIPKKDKSESIREKRADKSPDHKSRRHSKDSYSTDNPSKSSKDLRYKLEEKGKTKSAVDHRKLSVMDESEFIPDYEDLAPEGTSDNEHDDATTSQNSGASSPELSKDNRKRKRGEEEEEEEKSKKDEVTRSDSVDSAKHKKGKKKHKHKEKDKDKTKEKKDKHKHKKRKHKHKKGKDKDGKLKGSKDDEDDST